MQTYLSWALGKAPASEIQVAGLHVAAIRRPDANVANLIQAACNRLFDLNSVDGALAVWNAAVRAGLLGGGEAKRGRVTNGEFRTPAGGNGFDWAANKPNGGYVTQMGPAGGLQFHFNGEQCEQCPVLAQRIAVVPGQSYTARVKYRTQDFGRKSGLRWVASSAKAELGRMAEDLWSEDGGTAEFEFRVGDGVEWVRLEMLYQRPQGQVRGEGTVFLNSVELLP